MSKRHESKYKINRRLGENLWGRAKSPVNKREYGPGQHGQRRKKPTDFGVQLMAKQKLKFYYGNITERQFRKIYTEAIRKKGDTSENLIGLLERRLDAVVYRLKFAPTVFAARQLVSHGHITVNGKKVDIPSYRVSPNDIVEVRNRSREMTPFVVAHAEAGDREVPAWLEVIPSHFRVLVHALPKREQIDTQVQEQLIVELYSK